MVVAVSFRGSVVADSLRGCVVAVGWRGGAGRRFTREKRGRQAPAAASFLTFRAIGAGARRRPPLAPARRVSPPRPRCERAGGPRFLEELRTCGIGRKGAAA